MSGLGKRYVDKHGKIVRDQVPFYTSIYYERKPQEQFRARDGSRYVWHLDGTLMRLVHNPDNEDNPFAGRKTCRREGILPRNKKERRARRAYNRALATTPTQGETA